MTCQAIHCYDRACVRFAVYPEGPEGPRVLAEVPDDALRHAFGARGGPDSLVQSCEQNIDALEERVIRRFRLDPRQPVLLGTRDLFFVEPGAAAW